MRRTSMRAALVMGLALLGASPLLGASRRSPGRGRPAPISHTRPVAHHGARGTRLPRAHHVYPVVVRTVTLPRTTAIVLPRPTQVTLTPTVVLPRPRPRPLPGPDGPLPYDVSPSSLWGIWTPVRGPVSSTSGGHHFETVKEDDPDGGTDPPDPQPPDDGGLPPGGPPGDGGGGGGGGGGDGHR